MVSLILVHILRIETDAAVNTKTVTFRGIDDYCTPSKK